MERCGKRLQNPVATVEKRLGLMRRRLQNRCGLELEGCGTTAPDKCFVMAGGGGVSPSSAGVHVVPFACAVASIHEASG